MGLILVFLLKNPAKEKHRSASMAMAMASRRYLHFLTRYRQCCKTLINLSQNIAPITGHTFDGSLNSRPSHTFDVNFNVYPHSYRFTQHFCSRPSDDDDSDDEEESEGEEEDEGPALSAEDKEKEAAEIGYRVIGPLQKPEFVFKPYEQLFAVVQVGSHQFKVSNGDSIFTEKLKHCDINDKLVLNKVLLLGSKTQTIIGRPVLPDAAVHAVVEEHALDAKVIIFKKKRRKNYRRKTGHRQELTRLRITSIQGIEMPQTVAPSEIGAPSEIPLKTAKKEKPEITARPRTPLQTEKKGKPERLPA